jgi:hypothetical protein
MQPVVGRRGVARARQEGFSDLAEDGSAARVDTEGLDLHTDGSFGRIVGQDPYEARERRHVHWTGRGRSRETAEVDGRRRAHRVLVQPHGSLEAKRRSLHPDAARVDAPRRGTRRRAGSSVGATPVVVVRESGRAARGRKRIGEELAESGVGLARVVPIGAARERAEETDGTGRTRPTCSRTHAPSLSGRVTKRPAAYSGIRRPGARDWHRSSRTRPQLD